MRPVTVPHLTQPTTAPPARIVHRIGPRWHDERDLDELVLPTGALPGAGQSRRARAAGRMPQRRTQSDRRTERYPAWRIACRRGWFTYG